MPPKQNGQHATTKPFKKYPPRISKPGGQPDVRSAKPTGKPRQRNRRPGNKQSMSQLAAGNGSGHRHIRSSGTIGTTSRHNILSTKGSDSVTVYQPTKPSSVASSAPLVPGSSTKDSLYATDLATNIVNVSLTAGAIGNPFADFATGIYKRVKRARLSIAPDDYTAYDLVKNNMFATYSDALTAFEVYLFNVYMELINNTVVTAALPRNLMFLLKILARDNWYIQTNTINRIVYTASYPAQTAAVKAQVSTILKNNYLAYTLAETITTTSKAFPSSVQQPSTYNGGHNFVVYSSKKFSSVYSFYQDKTGGAPSYFNCSNGSLNYMHWPIICTLSQPLTSSAALPSLNPITYPNYTVSPDILRQWVAYEDALFDEEYFLTTTWGGANELLSTDPAFWKPKYNVYPGTDHFDDVFTETNLVNMNHIIEFARNVYAPFLHVGSFTNAQAIQSFGIVSQFKGPMHMPSVIHELIVGNTSCLSLSLKRDTKAWRGKFIHFPNPRSEVYNTGNILDMQVASQLFYGIRHFVKTNSFPESSPSKALIPSFFLEYPDIEGDTTLYYTPYSYQYVDSHNLSSLATNLYWPILNEVNTNVLASLNLACTIPKNQADSINYVDFLMFDFSFQSDNSEIDHYLHEIRINYLGGFGFLSGLMNKAKKFGNSVLNKVIRPALKNPLVETLVHVGAEAIGGPGIANMIDAGITMISTSPPGPPNNTNAIDLSQK